jgi:hypothetical protein
MPDNDFRIVVDGEDRRGAGTRMIRRNESVGVGAVVLLEPGAVRREGRKRGPRTILGEWVLRADEAGGCDRPIGDHHDRHEHDDEQTDRESGHRTEWARRALQFNKVHKRVSWESMAGKSGNVLTSITTYRLCCISRSTRTKAHKKNAAYSKR